MASYLSPVASIFQFFTDVGVPLNGGLLWTYAAGTSTPTTTWTDITGTVPNANPIQLASNGRLPNVQVWQAGGVPIKVQVSTNAGTVGSPVFGVQLGPTFDQISGINDPAATLTSLINPASGSGADLVANAMRSYDLVASVKAAPAPVLSVGQTLLIDLEGGSAVNDGNGGIFYWNASSTATDDGGLTTIKPTAAGATGRYLRLNVTYGIRGNFNLTVAGCTTAPTVAVNYVINGNVIIAEIGVPGGGALTSNSTGFSYTGWPSALLTTGISGLGHASCLVAAKDNGVAGLSATASLTNVTLGTALTLTLNNSTGLWTNSGAKGIGQFTFIYLLY